MKKFNEYDTKKDYIEITRNKIVYIKNNKKEEKNLIINYESFLKHIENLNYQESYNLIGGNKAKNMLFENITVPSFGKIFYEDACENNLCISDVKTLTDKYIETYFLKTRRDSYVLKKEYRLKNDTNYYFTYNDIAGRCYRSYCSLCREIALLLYLNDKYNNLEAIYNYEYDVVYGIDIIVKTQNKNYGLATYINTKESNKHRNYKKILFIKKKN